MSVAEREKEILKEDVLFGSGAIIPLNTHKAPAPCRRSKNKPLRLALPASNDSLPIARANAATWCAAPTPRARASLATICEIAPNIRHGKRYHPLSRERRSSGNLAIFAAMRHGPILFYRVQIEHGKIGRHVRLSSGVSRRVVVGPVAPAHWMANDIPEGITPERGFSALRPSQQPLAA